MPIIHMASNTDETFPDGAYCPVGLSYNRPDQIAEWKTNLAPNGLPYGPVVLYTSHHGLCLKEREANGYHDSDFYMLVWDAERGAPHEICFASTRGWSYPCYGSSVDATPEVVAAYEAWRTVQQAEYRRERRVAEIKRLRALVSTMRAAAKAHEVSYTALRQLQKNRPDQFPAALWLLTAKVRNEFKLKMRRHLIAWLRDPAPKYATPFSRKQLEWIPEYTGPGASRSR